jgi:hypothetical protein
MNEFIVWDKTKHKFIDEYNVLIDGSGTNVHNFNRDSSVRFNRDDKNELEICNYIGKTDTEGNKIYADCSIVEYLITYTDDCKAEIKRGIFTFNKYTSSFYIQNEAKQELATNGFWIKRASNFKVIGTLQEDKHLL